MERPVGDWDPDWHHRFASVGEDVYIGRYCIFTNAHKVNLRSKVRIDPYFLSTCGIEAAGYNHLCAHSAFNGGDKGLVTLGKWAFVGWGSRVFTASDDYTGNYGPHGPFGENLMHRGDVTFEDYAGVASGSTVMPGVHVPEGCVIGAHSYCPASAELEPWTIYVTLAGRLVPLKRRNEKACKEWAEKWESR